VHTRNAAVTAVKKVGGVGAAWEGWREEVGGSGLPAGALARVGIAWIASRCALGDGSGDCVDITANFRDFALTHLLNKSP
jgi:hypothetical protein